MGKYKDERFYHSTALTQEDSQALKDYAAKLGEWSTAKVIRDIIIEKLKKQNKGK